MKNEQWMMVIWVEDDLIHEISEIEAIVMFPLFLLPVVYMIEQEIAVPSEVDSTMLVCRSRKTTQFRFKCHLCKFGTDESLQELRSHLIDFHPT